jgi:hypothetical protein
MDENLAVGTFGDDIGKGAAAIYPELPGVVRG